MTPRSDASHWSLQHIAAEIWCLRVSSPDQMDCLCLDVMSKHDDRACSMVAGEPQVLSIHVECAMREESHPIMFFDL